MLRLNDVNNSYKKCSKFINWIFFLFLLKFSFLPLFAVQQYDSGIHINKSFFLYIIFYYGLSQDIEYNSLCYIY